MKNCGCLIPIIIVIIVFIGLYCIDVEKNHYKVEDSTIDEIIINTYTDICTIKYHNDVIHFDMDKTRVVVDSLKHEITIDNKTYQYK